MGYRLHYAKHYDPTFEGGFFNRDYLKWEKLFNEKFEKNGWKDPDADIYEVDRQDLQKYVETLKSAPEANNKYFKDYTNSQVQTVLEEILLSEDEQIRIEWF